MSVFLTFKKAHYFLKTEYFNLHANSIYLVETSFYNKMI